MYINQLIPNFSSAAMTTDAAPIQADTFNISSLSFSHESMLTLDSEPDFALDLGFESGLSLDLGPDLGLDVDSASASAPTLDFVLDSDLDLDPEAAVDIIMDSLTPDMRAILFDCLEAYQQMLMTSEE